MKLSGDRCQCRGCMEYFNSTAAFDKHRKGQHGTDRRCLPEQEMRGIGMDKNAAGYWITAKMPVRPVYAFGSGKRADISPA